jgi:hypothetical protein
MAFDFMIVGGERNAFYDAHFNAGRAANDEPVEDALERGPRRRVGRSAGAAGSRSKAGGANDEPGSLRRPEARPVMSSWQGSRVQEASAHRRQKLNRALGAEVPTLDTEA